MKWRQLHRHILNVHLLIRKGHMDDAVVSTTEEPMRTFHTLINLSPGQSMNHFIIGFFMNY